MRLGSPSGVLSGSRVPSVSFVDLTNALAAARNRGDDETANRIIAARNGFLGHPAGSAVPLEPGVADLVRGLLGRS